MFIAFSFCTHFNEYPSRTTIHQFWRTLFTFHWITCNWSAFQLSFQRCISRKTSLPTYIVSHCNHLARITTYLLTSLMLCVLILSTSSGNYSIKTRFSQKTAEGTSPDKYLFIIRFVRDICTRSWTTGFRLINQYTYIRIITTL